jgi:hypothetical protein
MRHGFELGEGELALMRGIEELEASDRRGLELLE